MFAVAFNSGSSPCSVVPAWNMWVPLSFHLYVVCVVYLMVCQELQVGYRGEWGRGEGSDMHVFVHVCIWMSLIVVLHSCLHTFHCVYVHVQGEWARPCPRMPGLGPLTRGWTALAF